MCDQISSSNKLPWFTVKLTLKYYETKYTHTIKILRLIIMKGWMCYSYDKVRTDIVCHMRERPLPIISEWHKISLMNSLQTYHPMAYDKCFIGGALLF